MLQKLVMQQVRSVLALISLSRQQSELSRNTILNTRSARKVLQKVVRGFLDADDNGDSLRNLIIRLLFGPFAMFLENCMQINSESVVIALSRQINKQKVCENN